MPHPAPNTCRLILCIGDVDYSLCRLEGPLPRWRLHRDGGPRYTVSRTPAGGIQCDCPDFAFRRGNDDNGFKHARAIVAAGLIETSPSGPGGRQAGETVGAETPTGKPGPHRRDDRRR